MKENIIIALKSALSYNFCTGEFVVMNVSLGIRTLETEGISRATQCLVLQINKACSHKDYFSKVTQIVAAVLRSAFTSPNNVSDVPDLSIMQFLLKTK